ncbi:MAG: hypothetical protein NXI01_08855 [Gammaproteobacteria bacterium]|nr:hypothetical protein [Gammaproteobacteria bacterium]
MRTSFCNKSSLPINEGKGASIQDGAALQEFYPNAKNLEHLHQTNVKSIHSLLAQNKKLLQLAKKLMIIIEGEGGRSKPTIKKTKALRMFHDAISKST